MSDFMAEYHACRLKEGGRIWDGGISTCEGCWSLTGSSRARFCEACADRKRCCKFCAADLRDRAVQETESSSSMHPLPVARLLVKTPTPSTPAWIIDGILALFVLSYVYASYAFIFLRS